MLSVMSVSSECHFLSTHSLLVNSLTGFELWLHWWLECDGSSAVESWNPTCRFETEFFGFRLKPTRCDLKLEYGFEIRFEHSRLDNTGCKSKH